MKLPTNILPVVLLTVAAALPSLRAQASAPDMPTDTVKVIDKADAINIIRTETGTVIEAFIGTDKASWNKYRYEVTVVERDSSTVETISENSLISLPFNINRKKSKTTSGRWKAKRTITAMRNLYWGRNFAYDGKSGIKNSFEIGIAEVIAVEFQPWRRGPLFRVGLGFGMKRWHTADGLYFGKDGDCLTIVPAITDASNIKSKFDVWSFHVPLMVSQPIYKSFTFAAGVLLNFNTYSKASTSFETADVRYSETFKGLQQRLLTPEIIGIIGFRDAIGFYAKYNPVPVMRSQFGPSFKSWSMGVSIAF